MTILIDTSVWIDLFADHDTLQTAVARHLIANEKPIAVGDLMLVELLQGTRGRVDFAHKLRSLERFDQISIVNPLIAIQAARFYIDLRGRGITIRKTIDTLIATRCILDRIPLLYSDRDFDPFVQHLGLRSAMDLDTGVA